MKAVRLNRLPKPAAVDEPQQQEVEMALQYENLDSDTRGHMLIEVVEDVVNGDFYESPRLTEEGLRQWPELLRDAVEFHTDDWLAAQLNQLGLLRAKEPSGRGGWKKVPHNAAQTLAEGEFNRYYARGLCLRAIRDKQQVQVYRGKAVSNPRSRSLALLGMVLDPEALVTDLRQSKGVEPALGLPPGPNSGLTIKLA